MKQSTRSTKVEMAVVLAAATGLVAAAWQKWLPLDVTEAFGFATGAVCVWLVTKASNVQSIRREAGSRVVLNRDGSAPSNQHHARRFRSGFVGISRSDRAAYRDGNERSEIPLAIAKPKGRVFLITRAFLVPYGDCNLRSTT